MEPLRSSSIEHRHFSARRAGVTGCHKCLLPVEIKPGRQPGFCPRCGARLHPRKPQSISRTWALICTAIILYIPANVLPITITSTIGSKQADTILSGVIYFFQTGSWGIAAIIFIASILVPLVKIIVLIFLLLSIQFHSTWRPKDRTRLYRFIDMVGRWSMVDIFVVTILVALVRLGPLATVEAGPAVVYFAGVVVVTMFAAESFDPRFIWDVIEEDA